MFSHTSFIVQIIFYCLSFKIRGYILRNQKVLIGFDAYLDFRYFIIWNRFGNYQSLK